MTSNQLLDLMNSIPDRFVMEGAEPGQRASHPRLHRMGLLVAVIAALLLLAGCVAVYLRLQDMSIGKAPYVQAFDEKGKAMEPVEKERTVINFAGVSGSPEQQASAQWYDFTESYDPDRKLLTNEEKDWGIPDNCADIYGCYTREMAEKLEEIAKTNQLALLEEEAVIQLYQQDVAMEALGVSSLLREEAAASMGQVSGVLYAPYNFSLSYTLRLTGEDAKWSKRVNVTEIYQRSGYLPAPGSWNLDLQNFQQWNYTTSQGVSLLLAMDKTGRSFLVHQQKDGILTVSIDGNPTGSRYPQVDQIPGKEAIEQFAEVIDFTITPPLIDIPSLQPELEAAEAEYQASQTYVPETYGSYGEYLLERGYAWMPGNQYAFSDLNGDGEEELLLGQDGWCENWLTIRDGQVESIYGNVGVLFRPCQEGMWAFFDQASFTQVQRYWYTSVMPGSGSEDSGGITFQGIVYRDGQWWKYDEVRGVYRKELQQVTTQAEADAIRAAYQPVRLDWRELGDFPMDEKGGTLGSYLQALDEKPTREAVRAFYRDMLRGPASEAGFFFTHYRLLDLNGDGIEDLLLSGDGEMFWEFQAYRYGRIAYTCPMDLWLCENGILEDCSILRQGAEGGDIEIEEHVFYEFREDFELEVVGYAAYNKATASWQSDRDGTPMDTAEAEALLARYPRIDQEMRPISELLG